MEGGGAVMPNFERVLKRPCKIQFNLSDTSMILYVKIWILENGERIEGKESDRRLAPFIFFPLHVYLFPVLVGWQSSCQILPDFFLPVLRLGDSLTKDQDNKDNNIYVFKKFFT